VWGSGTAPPIVGGENGSLIGDLTSGPTLAGTNGMPVIPGSFGENGVCISSILPAETGVAPITEHGAAAATGVTRRSRVLGSAYSLGAVALCTAFRTFGTDMVSVPAPTTGQTQAVMSLAVFEATIDPSITIPLRHMPMNGVRQLISTYITNALTIFF
jgi:hypothetical protein